MRKILISVFLVILVLTLMGCTMKNGQVLHDRFVCIEERNVDYEYLVYDNDTFIVYYCAWIDARAALCPYYSENGYICRYNVETKSIEEIIH